MAEVTTLTPRHKARKQPRTDTVPPPGSPAQPPTDQPAPDPPPAAAAPPPEEKRKHGRPKVGEARPEPPFFDLVRRVPEADWGTRAYIYCYVTEPICDLKQQGKYAYLFRSSEPILDLEKIMQDYGSFKGYLSLNRRKSGQNGTDLIDTFEFEIYNPNHPPKIPRSVWMNDPRNKKWLDLLPPEGEKKTEPNPNDMLKTFMDIRRDVREELLASQADRPEPPDPADQFGVVVSTAEKFLNMALGNQPKNDNTAVLSFLTAQLKGVQDQNTMLLAKLLDGKKTETTSTQDPIETMKKTMEVLKQFREELAPEAAAGGTPAQSRMNGWQEFGVEMMRAFSQSPALTYLAQGFLAWSMKGQSGAQPMPGQPPQGTQPAAALPPGASATPPPVGAMQKLTAQQLSRGVPSIINPLIQHLMDKDKDGYDFAEWLIAGQGKNAYEFLRSHGEEVLMQSFRLSAFWAPGGNGFPGLSSMEDQLRELIEEFCSWPPDEEAEGPQVVKPNGVATGTAKAGAPIDLTEDAPQAGVEQ